MNRGTSYHPLFLMIALTACEELESDDGCPPTLPAAPVFCDAPDCRASTGERTFVQSSPDLSDGPDWLVISSLSSEIFDTDNAEISYGQETTGALSAERVDEPVRRRGGLPEVQRARVAAEGLIRRNTAPWPPVSPPLRGTAIRDRTADLLPAGAVLQQDACSAANPQCSDARLCVIPNGSTAGTCTGQIQLNWRDQDNPGMFVAVDAVVRGVGQRAAVVVEVADDARLDQATVDTFISRFDTHIGPLAEAFFGRPVDNAGQDRDQNGVTLFFFTSRVGRLRPGLVGFFQATDLIDPAMAPGSNAADLLYLEPPGPEVTLDNLSATAAHEYQHLINYYAKVINRDSSPETRWLDEGLSSFAEDALGYGSDAFSNVAVYLANVGITSLTGFGLVNNPDEADSPERRGMAHLLVRYLFERSGGAVFSGAGQVSDNGGVAAVRALVQAADTGSELFTQSRTGRTFADWQTDLLTAVAIDGANFPGVSCNPEFTFAAPTVDGFTGYQRGLDLRTPLSSFAGTNIPLNGPVTEPYGPGRVPVPVNGGEIRTLRNLAEATTLSISGDAQALADHSVQLRVVPTARP